MSFINPNWYLTLVIGVVLFHISTVMIKKNPQHNRNFLFISLILFVFSLLYPFSYISDTLSQLPLYCQWRTLPFSEVFICLSAPFFAYLALFLFNPNKRQSTIYYSLLLIALGYLSIPYIKPVIRPLNTDAMRESWSDRVCLQSSASTCGPACLTTIFNYYGLADTERNIATQAFSCGSGTENWYLARYAKSQGFQIHYSTAQTLNDVPIPAIIGVKTVGGFGHFITVLKDQNGIFQIGDPLYGSYFLSTEEFNQQYTFTGFTLSITR